MLDDQQNRADAKRQVVANLQWRTVHEEDRQNEELLKLSQQILELTREIHSSTDVHVARRQDSAAVASAASGSSEWGDARRSREP